MTDGSSSPAVLIERHYYLEGTGPLARGGRGGTFPTKIRPLMNVRRSAFQSTARVPTFKCISFQAREPLSPLSHSASRNERRPGTREATPPPAPLPLAREEEGGGEEGGGGPRVPAREGLAVLMVHATQPMLAFEKPCQVSHAQTGSRRRIRMCVCVCVCKSHRYVY